MVACAAASDATASVFCRSSVVFDSTASTWPFGHHVAHIDQKLLQRLAFDQGAHLHLFDGGQPGPRR